MNEIAARLIEYARDDDYKVTAQLMWSAASEINRLEHEKAELIYEIELIKSERKKK
jgi:hypothetical protein